MSHKVPKEDVDLFRALRDDLQICKDAMSLAVMGRLEYVRVITTLLRTLICDESNKTGGLLVYLIQRYHFTGGIILESGEMSLMDYKQQVVERVSGGEDYQRTRCEIIKARAEQDGIAHEDISRTRENFSLNAVFEMSKTKKTNLELGLFCLWCRQVLNLGERFLAQYGIYLK